MAEQNIKWDDLRFVLAIERSGSLSGAGRSLSLSHATVFRRLEALESRLGVRFLKGGAMATALPRPANDLSWPPSVSKWKLRPRKGRLSGRT